MQHFAVFHTWYMTQHINLKCISITFWTSITLSRPLFRQNMTEKIKIKIWIWLLFLATQEARLKSRLITFWWLVGSPEAYYPIYMSIVYVLFFLEEPLKGVLLSFSCHESSSWLRDIWFLTSFTFCSEASFTIGWFWIISQPSVWNHQVPVPRRQ